MLDINIEMSKSNNRFVTIQNNLLLFMCVLFYSSLGCTFAYAKVYLKTTIIKKNIKIILIAGVPSSQALPGFLITAPPCVWVSAVLGVLAVWIQKKRGSFFEFLAPPKEQLFWRQADSRTFARVFSPWFRRCPDPFYIRAVPIPNRKQK